MKATVIHLTSFDDVSAVRAKLKQCRTLRALLVIPRDSIIRGRYLDLLILYRAAQRHGIRLALVVNQTKMVQQANRIGIPVFSNVEAADRRSWRASSGMLGENQSPDEREKRRNVIDRSCRPDRFVGRTSGYAWRRWLYLIIGILSVLAILFLFLPSAEIALAMAAQTQSLTMDVRANPEVATLNLSGGVPVYIETVVVEGAGELESTGNVFLPDARSTGSIMLINISDQSVNVPAGTVVLTISVPVVRFETLQTVRVSPNDEEVAVDIRAIEPGSGGNVEAGLIAAFENQLGLQLLVRNPEPVKGGLEQAIPIPLEADYRRLRQHVLQELGEIALDELQEKMGPGQKLISVSLEIEQVLEEHREPSAGQPADHLELAMRVEFSAWYVQESDQTTYARSILDASMDERQTAIADTLVVSSIEEANLENGSAWWKIYAVRQIRDEWDPMTSSMLIGKTMAEAKSILEDRYSLAGSPDIHIKPEFWPRMPALSYQIRVRAE